MRMDANTWPAVAPTGPPPMGWMTGSGNISYMITNDASTASHFFDTPASFCTGISLTTSPVPGGYKTTPVLNLSSYTNSSTATSGGNADPGLVGDGTTGPNGGLLPKGAITYPYKYIAYDNEQQASTPTVEQDDPPAYMQEFTTACHNAGYKVILAPAWSLFAPAKAMYPLTPSTETQEHWFVRVIVGMGAVNLTAGDIFLLQNESQQGTSDYATLWNDTVAQLASVAPSALVFADVSSQNAQTGSLTGPQLGTSMASDAQTLTSPYPDGFYVAMPSSVTNGQAGGRYFLDDMMAAGYSA